MLPISRKSWKKPTRNPLTARGELSETYVGASMLPAPRPRPSRKLEDVSDEVVMEFMSKITVQCRTLADAQKIRPA